LRSLSLEPPNWVTARPGLTVLVIVLLTGLGLSRLIDFETGGPRLLLDPSANSMLPADSEDSRYYEKIRDLFGNDEQVVVALNAPDVFTPETLRAVVRIADRLAKLDGVRRVDSLAGLLRTGDPEQASGEPSVVVPGDPEAIERLRTTTLENPVLGGNLVSRDSRTTALLVQFEDLSEQEIYDRGLDEKIKAIADEEHDEGAVWVTGGARVKAEMTRLLLRDLTVIVPVAVFIMACVGFAAFRTFRGVLVPLSTIAVGLIWLLAIIAETVGTLNQVTVAVPPILIVVGFAYTIHVLSAYYTSLRDGERGREAVRHAIDHVSLPVILTGLTTCAGFASLATSDLGAIKQFGLFTALGVAFTTLASLSFAPALLALLPDPRRLRDEPASGRFDEIVERIAKFDVRQRRTILWVGAGIALVSLIGMARIEVSTDLVRNFKPDAGVRRDFEAVNEALSGANSFYVVLESVYRGSFELASSLRTVESLQSWLDNRPEIGGTTSVLDHLEAADRAMGGGEGSVIDRIEAGAPIAPLLEAIPENQLATVLDSAHRTANIQVRTPAIDSSDIVRLVTEIEEHFSELPRNVIPGVTGGTVLMSRTVDEIALGQASSLSTAFLIIFAILVLLFASFRVGLMALIPNVLPVLFYFGVLGWSGITLNTTTGLVASLVLGIAVDDTIHYMAQFNEAAKKHADTRRGVLEAMRSIIRPVTYTTVSLCLGFSALLLSGLRNQVEFGMLAATTLAFAWLVDITFTPAMAARMRVVTLWDILALDLGPEPQRAVPLFAGLRETQARVVTLLGRLQHIHKGHQVTAFGAEGEEMYIVIDGEIELTLPRDGEDVSLQTARRGDTFGEGAVFHGRRIADATAVSDSRLLLLSEEDLGRLRDQYPRVAARVYHNLSRILAVQLGKAAGMVAFPPETRESEGD
jgi:hydrophobe/amphiphile efflux-3 (HAE3) family protein